MSSDALDLQEEPTPFIHDESWEAVEAHNARFWAAVQEGIDSLERGEGVVIDDISAHFAAILAEVEARSR